MKEFFKWVLVGLLFGLGTIGDVCIKGSWTDIVAFPVSLLIFLPAILWWKEYLDELFDK